MTDEGAPTGFPEGGPPGAKPGWYRNRTTGRRRYWNGTEWVNLVDLITPFPLASVRPIASSPPPPSSPAAPREKPVTGRRKLIAWSALAIVVVAVLGTVIANSGTTGSAQKTSGRATTQTVAASELPATSLPAIPTTGAPSPAVAAAPTTPGPTVATGTDTQCAPSSNLAVTAVPDSALDNLFQSYGNLGRGSTWTGGDGTESVPLPDGRELWFFGDSFLSKITNGHWTQPGGALLHNTMVVERNGVLTRTLHGGPKDAPVAYVNPDPQDPADYGFWPGSMVVRGNVLQVIGLDVKFTGNGTYSVLGNSIATLALPRLTFLGLQTLPATPTDWSDGVLRDGGYTYLFGSAQPNTYVARVRGTDLTVPWSYYDGSGWTSDPAAAVPIENIGTVSHFSVSKVGSTYVFIAKSSWLTNEITVSIGCSPMGPFGPAEPIYATPEASAYPASYDVVTYGAFAHPELSTLPNTLVVSYDVGAVDPITGSLMDASLDRPRFLDVTIP